MREDEDRMEAVEEWPEDEAEEREEPDEEAVLKEARRLWHQYLVLTHELMKFIDRKDIDTFLSIVPQRGTIVERMKALPKNGFRETEECKKLIEEIRPLDMQIIYKAKAWLNKSRRQNSTVRAYDLTGAGGALARTATGGILNRKL